MLTSSKWGVICSSLRVLIKHMMSIQAKKIQNDPITKYHINNIHQITSYNQTLRFSCNNIVNIYGGDSLCMRIVDIEKFNNQQYEVFII